MRQGHLRKPLHATTPQPRGGRGRSRTPHTRIDALVEQFAAVAALDLRRATVFVDDGRQDEGSARW